MPPTSMRAACAMRSAWRMISAGGRAPSTRSPVLGASMAQAPRTSCTPPVVWQVERIAQAARIDVGGIELLVDDRDGQHYFYDVNALSNFVADAPNVVGFDPWVNLVDYLEVRAGYREAGAARPAEVAA